MIFSIDIIITKNLQSSKIFIYLFPLTQANSNQQKLTLRQIISMVFHFIFCAYFWKNIYGNSLIQIELISLTRVL